MVKLLFNGLMETVLMTFISGAMGFVLGIPVGTLLFLTREYGIINNTFAGPAGLIAKRDGLFVEESRSPYVNVIVCRHEDRNNENLRQWTQSYESPEVVAVADSAFKGGAIRGW